jgi:hypothetical protein
LTVRRQYQKENKLSGGKLSNEEERKNKSVEGSIKKKEREKFIKKIER